MKNSEPNCKLSLFNCNNCKSKMCLYRTTSNPVLESTVFYKFNDVNDKINGRAQFVAHGNFINRHDVKSCANLVNSKIY